MPEDNPILRNYIKHLEDPSTVKRVLPKQRVMKKFSGSPCTPENRCKCTHFKRYHVVNEVNGVPESGACYYCTGSCKEWRARDPEQDKKLAARKRGNQGQYKQYFR